MRRAVLSLLVALAAWLQASAAAPRGRLVVVAENLRSERGAVMIALFASEEGFPKKSELAFLRAKAAIAGGRARAVFQDVPYGTYAASLFHDENGTGRLETSWLGVPKEGYGISNDAVSLFGPDFGKARFAVDSPEREIRIRVRY